LKPFGSLSFSIGISLAGVSVILPGCGASFDSACAGGLPWCQAGGGLGCAKAGAANAAETATAMTLFNMFFLLCGDANATPPSAKLKPQICL
jgi:hypothetical protein